MKEKGKKEKKKMNTKRVYWGKIKNVNDEWMKKEIKRKRIKNETIRRKITNKWWMRGKRNEKGKEWKTKLLEEK